MSDNENDNPCDEEDDNFNYIECIKKSFDASKKESSEISIDLINRCLNESHIKRYIQEPIDKDGTDQNKPKIQHVSVWGQDHEGGDKGIKIKHENINVVEEMKGFKVYSHEKEMMKSKEVAKDKTKRKDNWKSKDLNKCRSEQIEVAEDNENMDDLDKLDIISQTTDIPKTYDEFRKLFFALDSSKLDDDDSESPFQFTQASSTFKYKHEFTTPESYIDYHIPQVFNKMWQSLKSSWKRAIEEEDNARMIVKDKDKARQALFELPFLSIREMKRNHPIDGICTLKCIAVRKRKFSSKFSFGQVVLLTFFEKDIDNFKQDIHVFGIITNHIEVAVFNPNRHEKIVLEAKCNADDLENMLIDDFEIETRIVPDSSRLHSNGFSLNCVNSFLVQARAIYNMSNIGIGNELARQIMKPCYDFGPVGISIDMKERTSIKFSTDQLDAIQKAYQTFFMTDTDFSNVVCIYGPRMSGKTEIMRETLLQLLEFGSQTLSQESKILIISSKIERKVDSNEAKQSETKSIVDHLRSHNIKVYHVINEKMPTKNPNEKITRFSPNVKEIKEEAARIVEINMSNEEELKLAYNDCIDFFNGNKSINQLNPLSLVLEERFRNIAKNNLMNEAQVIIGNIDAVTNDAILNSLYGPNRSKISYAFIDDAQWLSESQVTSLLHYGVKKIVMLGQCYGNHSTPIVKNFFNRYISHFHNQFLMDHTKFINSKKRYNQATSSVIQFTQEWSKINNNKSPLQTRRENKRGNHHEVRGRSHHDFRGYNSNQQRYNNARSHNFDRRDRKQKFQHHGSRSRESNDNFRRPYSVGRVESESIERSISRDRDIPVFIDHRTTGPFDQPYLKQELKRERPDYDIGNHYLNNSPSTSTHSHSSAMGISLFPGLSQGQSSPMFHQSRPPTPGTHFHPPANQYIPSQYGLPPPQYAHPGYSANPVTLHGQYVNPNLVQLRHQAPQHYCSPNQRQVPYHDQNAYYHSK